MPAPGRGGPTVSGAEAPAPRSGAGLVWRATLVSLLLGGGAALAVFWWLGEDLRTLARVPWWALLAGVGWVALNHLCGGVRLALLSRLVGHPVKVWRATRAYALGLFSAAVSPGGAGQAPAVVLALVDEGMSASLAWSISVYVWVLDLTFLGWSVPLAILLLGRSSALPLGDAPLTAALLAGAAFLAAGWLLAYRIAWLRRGGFWAFSWGPLRRWRRALLRFVARTAAATRVMRKQPWPLQLLLHTLTTVLYLATYLVFATLVWALGSHAAPLPAVAAVLLPSVLSFLFPTPGGSGFVELSAASLFRGQNPGVAVATAVVVWRLLTFYSRYLMGAALGGPVLVRALDAMRRARRLRHT